MHEIFLQFRNLVYLCSIKWHGHGKVVFMKGYEKGENLSPPGQKMLAQINEILTKTDKINTLEKSER
jgi:hypothetical protein